MQFHWTTSTLKTVEPRCGLKCFKEGLLSASEVEADNETTKKLRLE